MAFYRGADLKSLNQNEFLSGAINGGQTLVVNAEMTPEELAENWQAQALYNIEDAITDREEVWVTGGLTDTLPAAVKFTKQIFPPGIVLHMDESRIPESVDPIQYDADWFDAHPGALAHVSTLHDGELHVNGEIRGLLRVDDDKAVISEWGRDRVESQATMSTYTSEREMVAFTDTIPLGDAVNSMATYLGTTGVSPYTIYNALSESPGYRSSLGTIKNRETREVAASDGEYREQAALLYDELTPAIQYEDAPFYLVAVESRNDVQAEDGRITPENFRFVYNGRGFDTSYERNSHLLGGGG